MEYPDFVLWAHCGRSPTYHHRKLLTPLCRLIKHELINVNLSRLYKRAGNDSHDLTPSDRGAVVVREEIGSRVLRRRLSSQLMCNPRTNPREIDWPSQ